MSKLRQLPRENVLGLLLCFCAALAWFVYPNIMGGSVAVFSFVLVLLQSNSHYHQTRALQAQAATHAICEAFPDAVLTVKGDGTVSFSKDVQAPRESIVTALVSGETLLPELVGFAKDFLNTRGPTSTKRTTLPLGDRVLECRASRLNDSEVLIIARDITEAHTHGERIRYLATHDSLTGLLNRGSFMVALDQAVARSRRTQKPFGLLFLDLNHFKKVNDTYGHAAGDELLQKVAKRLSGSLRGSDSAYRLAGDEFTVIVEQLDHADDVKVVANKLYASLAQPYFEDPTAPAVSASIGAVTYPRDGDTAAKLLDCADKAMYQDKASSR